jgi:two-component system chemotaxis sensor kinase CheA
VNDRALSGCAQRVNLITTELRERVLKTRMRPVNAVWSAIPRLVRDTALACGKQVNVHMEGEDTELDKTVLEAIKDPLTHCVRNSVDHGIEAPDDRVVSGKPPEGTLSLRASHENGNVIIEISDDGAGINLERVREKALENGLVTISQLETMNDRAIAELIFAPGFSTAAEVTNVSGRGVGMDVVRTNVERIGGTVEVNTVRGQGSTFTITIPLTLAIIPALIVGCDGDRYAIPQHAVVEIVRVPENREGLSDVSGALVYRLRGNLLPLVELRTQLGSSSYDGERPMHIVVLRGTGNAFGVIVDEVHSTEEIVVKPLGLHYASIGVFAGATVMGDGRVALILDVANLADKSQLGASDTNHALEDSNTAFDVHHDSMRVLLVQVGNDRRLALPLRRVERLENFQRAQLQRTGSRTVVQYRYDVLPVVPLDEIIGERGAGDLAEQVLAVVVSAGAGEIGLLVGRILEVSNAHSVENGDRHGAVRTAIVDGAVTDLVDLDQVLGTAGIGLKMVV